MQSNVEVVNGYMEWLRDKQLYPTRHSPEEYFEEILQKDAKIRLQLIAEYLESLQGDEAEVHNPVVAKIHDLVFANLEDE